MKLSLLLVVVFTLLSSCNSAVDELDKSTADRVTDGLLLLYLFDSGSEIQSGLIRDNSSAGPSLPVVTTDPSTSTWLENGLRLDSQTIFTSAPNTADKINDTIPRNNALTIEAWVRPDNLTQTGPARIVSISTNTQNRNLTLAQSGTNYVVRLRAANNSLNGTQPSFSVAGATMDISHIVFTYAWDSATGEANFYKDGNLLSRSSVFQGNLDRWDNYPINLGNEININDATARFWLGDMYLIAIYDRALSLDEVRTNYTVGY